MMVSVIVELMVMTNQLLFVKVSFIVQTYDINVYTVYVCSLQTSACIHTTEVVSYQENVSLLSWTGIVLCVVPAGPEILTQAQEENA